MLKTKPQPGTKIRCVDTGGYRFMTKGKIYEVMINEDYGNEVFAYLDDDGDAMWDFWRSFGKIKFELV